MILLMSDTNCKSTFCLSIKQILQKSIDDVVKRILCILKQLIRRRKSDISIE